MFVTSNNKVVFAPVLLFVRQHNCAKTSDTDFHKTWLKDGIWAKKKTITFLHRFAEVRFL